MKKISIIKKFLSVILFVAASGAVNKISAQAITENFDDITLLTGNGWFMQNNSVPVGVTNWFQGTNVAAGGPFDSYNGAANSYIGANFNNTTGANTISNWLVTPNRTFRNGDVVTFFTRKYGVGTDYPDRLEVRMSTNGASTNVGTGSAAVGDFTTLLLSINPTLVVGGYPYVWTQYTITVSGLPAPTSGRMAFRYFVTNGGPTGTNSDYIGIDAFQYTPYVCPAITLSSGPLANGVAGTSYSQVVTQTGCLGAPSFAVTAGALPPGVTLSSSGTISGTPTATGTFNFTITASDNSGCSGSQAYSITVTCPTNGASLSSFPLICSNDAPYTLSEGSPAGGTYSGTGVTSGSFDPTAGTQVITYDLVDAYGCAQSATGTLTVNNPTTSSQTVVTCDSYLSPKGNTYTVTGIYTDTLTNLVGCDSIITTDLTIKNSTASSQTVTNCGSYLSPAGHTYTVTGMYTDTIPNLAGCDSIISIDLTINNSTASSLTVSNCNSYLSPAGHTYTVTGMYTDTIPNLAGCDSIISIDLTIKNSTASSQTVTNCGSYLSPAGHTYTVTGMYTDTIPNLAGCDSIISLNVTINNSTASSQTVTSCFRYTAPSGAVFSSSGVYTDTIPNMAGCDSILTINLTINTVDTSVSIAVVTLTANAVSATYQWLDCSNSYAVIGGANNVSYTPSVNGTYAVSVTKNGCTDTSSCHTVMNVGISENNASAVFAIYPNPTNGNVVLESATTGEVVIYNQLNQVIYSAKIQEGHNTISLANQPEGIYLVRYSNAYGSHALRLIKQ
ncbi:MAG: choice-of-anchor J domain-containing protein [Bacteroidia bacterium]